MGGRRNLQRSVNRDACEGTSGTPRDEFRVPQDRGVASQEGPCYREPGRIGRGTSQQLRVRRRHELRAPGEPERPRSQASLATRSAALPRGGATPPGLHHRGPPGASPDPPARPPALGPRKKHAAPSGRHTNDAVSGRRVLLLFLGLAPGTFGRERRRNDLGRRLGLDLVHRGLR